MLRKISTLLVVGLFVFGGLGPASAQSDLARHMSSKPEQQTTTSAANAPLAPGAAAGVKEAQGAQRNRIWTYVPFAVVTGLALVIVLATGDDDESTTVTTGSN